jgi:hypothetical protein
VAIGVLLRSVAGAPKHLQRLPHVGRTHVPRPVRAAEARRSAVGRRVVAWSARPTRSARRREVAQAPIRGLHPLAHPESAKVGPTGRARAVVLRASSAVSDVPLRLTR